MTDDTSPSDASSGDDSGDSSSGTLGDYRSTLDYSTPDFLSRWSDGGGDDAANVTSEMSAPPASDAPASDPERAQLLEQVRNQAAALRARKLEEAARERREVPARIDHAAANEERNSVDNAAINQATSGARMFGFIAAIVGIAGAIINNIGFMWAGAGLAISVGLMLIVGKIRRGTGLALITMGVAALTFHFAVGGIGAVTTGTPVAGGAALGSASLPSYTGTGDMTINVTLPDGPGALAVLDITTRDRYASITEVLADGDTSYLGSVWDEGTHSVIINTRKQPTVALKISSDESWTIALRSVSTLPILNDSMSGEGATLVRYDGAGGLVSFTFDGESSIEIETHGSQYWSFRADYVLTMTRNIPPGPYIIDIDVDGPWDVTIGPSSTSSEPPGSSDPSPTPDP